MLINCKELNEYCDFLKDKPMSKVNFMRNWNLKISFVANLKESVEWVFKKKLAPNAWDVDIFKNWFGFFDFFEIK